jgi:hypothetical protein
MRFFVKDHIFKRVIQVFDSKLSIFFDAFCKYFNEPFSYSFFSDQSGRSAITIADRCNGKKRWIWEQ